MYMKNPHFLGIDEYHIFIEILGNLRTLIITYGGLVTVIIFSVDKIKIFLYNLSTVFFNELR